jgi:hypothetical protein
MMMAKANKPRSVLEQDPVWQAMQRAPAGPPMTEEERRAKAEAEAIGGWIDGTEVSAEITRRCKSGK